MTDDPTREVMGIKLSPGATNCYLLEADRGYLLIDTGYEWEYRSFLAQLADAGVAVDEIEYLLLTHHHDDHVGFANELLEGVTVIAHEAAEDLLQAGENDRSGGGLLNRRVYYLAKVRSWLTPEWDLTFPPVTLRDDDMLVDGDDDQLLRELGIDGTILETPGHTPDSISVLLDDGTLFCGDAAMSRPLWAGIKYHTIFITDVDQYYESWQKILGSGAKRVYPAHGDPFDVERLREHMGAYSDDSLIERDPITSRYADFG
ncbi:MBL fold metallo-hydrolase [Halosolutus amylolyticus]|uniref:MBL fold metallo-hydrolase n=1 Tax=Halosolutus amylolyticus TaxID=2932267 RepID=A0ABD5PLU7_9EURY|nr:MBL fold metallo-hydrolase [Halosolutus amylolyticus]